MKLSINTGICPIIDVGMYESMLSPDDDSILYDAERELSADEYNEFSKLISDNFDMVAYENNIAEKAIDFLEGLFSDLSFRIKIIPDDYSINSPKEYNFRSDELDFTIEVDDLLPGYIKSQIEIDEKFWKKMEIRFGSYDGLISFMPYYKDKYMEALEGKDVERAVAMYLYYIIGNKQDEFEMFALEGIDYMDYVNSERASELYARC